MNTYKVIAKTEKVSYYLTIRAKNNMNAFAKATKELTIKKIQDINEITQLIISWKSGDKNGMA